MRPLKKLAISQNSLVQTLLIAVSGILLLAQGLTGFYSNDTSNTIFVITGAAFIAAAIVFALPKPAMTYRAFTTLTMIIAGLWAVAELFIAQDHTIFSTVVIIFVITSIIRSRTTD
jgi:hypothetical protein